jgi:diguanylate cyclase (GGDEF)-like protein
MTTQLVSGSTIALLFIDLDGFKRVNDDFSHEVGDFVLRAVAQRLLGVVRQHDCVVRWGGDEFIVMVHPLPEKRAAIDLAERIATALSTPFAVDDIQTGVTSSIGVAFSEPGDILDVEDLLRNADTAMYRAKREGKSSFAIFDGEVERWSARTQHIEKLLGYAAAEGRVEVHYQPIVRIDDGTVVAVEALMRLRDDDGGLLYPESFLCTAQETGALQSLEDVALSMACAEVANWRRLGFALRLSFNLEVERLGDLQSFERQLRHALGGSDLSADALSFEINDRCLNRADPAALAGLSSLVGAGVGFSIDGFGSGFASLKSLRSIPVSEIKIDRTYIQEAPTDKVAAAVVRAHASLAQQLGLRCVAKGVETREQDAFLRTHAITFGQGFLYEQPLRPEALTDFLRRRAAQSLGPGDAEGSAPPRVEG